MVPFIGAPLVAAGGAALVTAWVLHLALWGLAPLNLVFLWLNFRRHHDPIGLFVASAGALFVVVGMGGHFTHVLPHDAFIYPGLALILGGILLDWRSQRLLRVKV